MYPAYHNWMALLDLRDKRVKLVSKDDKGIKRYLSNYGAILVEEDNSDYLVQIDVGEKATSKGHKTLVTINENLTSYTGLNGSGLLPFCNASQRYLIFRRPHEKGYKYIAPFKTPLSLYIPCSSGLTSKKSALVWLAHSATPIFKRLMPAEMRIYGENKNPLEHNITSVLNEQFSYNGQFDYALIGDTKQGTDSRVVCLVQFQKTKYIMKFQRWGDGKNLKDEFSRLTELNSLGVISQPVFYSENPSCLCIKYIEGNNLLDEFAIHKDVSLLKAAISEVGRIHKIQGKNGKGITHNDLGAVNFICRKNGRISIIDWESVDFKGDQKEDAEKAIRSLSVLYHKVMGNRCCSDDRHKGTKEMLKLSYSFH